MAFPGIPTLAANRVLVLNQLNSTNPRTFPDLGPLTKNPGDLLIAIIVAYQTTAAANAAFSGWTGGFTEFHDSSTSTSLAIGCAYKWSTGSETGTFAVTQAATITGDASMIVLSIEGAHATTPPEAGSRASGTTTAADPVAFNPAGWAVEDTLWISVIGSGMTSATGSWTGTGTTYPANYTDGLDTNAADTSTIGDVEAGVSFRQLSTGSEDVGTAGVDTSNARNAAVVIAVRPSSAGAQLVYVTANYRYIQKIQLVGPFSSVIRVLAVEAGTVGAVAATATATATVTAARSDAAAVSKTTTATAVVTAGRVDAAAVAASTTGTATVTGTRSDAAAVSTTTTSTATVTGLTGTIGSVSATTTATATVTATVTSPAAVSRTTTAAATVTGARSDAGAVSATTTALRTVTANVTSPAAVSRTTTALSTVTAAVGTVGAVNSTTTTTQTVTAVRSDAATVSVTSTTLRTVTANVSSPATVNQTTTAAATVTTLRSDSVAVSVSTTATAIVTALIQAALVPRPPSGFVDRPASTVVDRPFAGNVSR